MKDVWRENERIVCRPSEFTVQFTIHDKSILLRIGVRIGERERKFLGV